MLDFPASPTVNQIYTSGSSNWQWDGTKWLPYSAGSPYLLLTGGTLTGNLTIAPAGTASLVLRKAASGQQSSVTGYMGANPRWELILGTNEAEGGSNAGSNFYLNRYSDAGAYIDSPLSINRVTGNMSLTGTLTVTAGGGITIAPVSGTAQLFLRKSASAQNNLFYGFTGANARWAIQMGNGAAESGSNAGSDFVISRYNDGGIWLADPFVISRASGLVTIATASIAGQTAPFLPIAGGTLTGTLTMGTNAINFGSGGTTALFDYLGVVYLRSGSHRFENTSGSVLFGTVSSTGFALGGATMTFRGGAGDSGQLKCWNTADYVNFRYDAGANRRLNWRVNEATEAAIISSSNLQTLVYASGWGGPTNWVLLGYDFAGGWQASYSDSVSSDERIKERIAPTRIDALAALTAFQVSEFDYKAEVASVLTGRATKEPVHIPIGFVAQHVAPHVPEAAFVPPIAYPADSPIPSDGMMVAQHNFIPYLVRAVQQLSEQNAAMAARLTAAGL